MTTPCLLLQRGAHRLGVRADLGGHIVEYSYEGRNALAVDKPEIGSTFWPSPQHAWGWPPPQTLDKAPYDVIEATGDRLVLESAVCPQTGLRLRKQFVLHETQLEVVYRTHNASAEPVSYAPWEITRIDGGVTFFAGRLAPLPQSTGTLQVAEGCYWHHYQPHQQTHNEKIYANGSEGWLANLHQGLLLIKQFAPVPANRVAPEEAEIEIYGHGDASQAYIEIEQQGEYQTIEPGADFSWSVVWRLAPWKATSIEVGDVAIVAAVKNRLHTPHT